YEADARAVVEGLLHELSLQPSELSLYKELHIAALKYKAAGGRPLGMRAFMARLPKQHIGRVNHYTRLWAFDVMSVDGLIQVHNAVAACDTPEGAFYPIVIWLKKMHRELTAVAGGRADRR